MRNFERFVALPVATGMLVAGCSVEEQGPVQSTIVAEYGTTTLETYPLETLPPVSDSIDITTLPEEVPEEIEYSFDTTNTIKDSMTVFPGDVTNLPSIVVEKIGDSYEGEEGSTNYRQSAVITFEGDTVVFNETDGLSNEQVEFLQSLVADSKQILEVAFKSGVLKEIIFGAKYEESDLSSHFNPFGGLVFINLEEQNMNYQELLASLRHEAWHSIDTNLPYQGDAYDLVYETACQDVIKDQEEEVKQIVLSTAVWLRQLVDQNKSTYPELEAEYGPSIDIVVNYLETDQPLDDFTIFDSCGALYVGYSLTGIEEKFYGIDTSEGSSVNDQRIKMRSLIFEDDLIKIMDEIPDTDPFKRAYLREAIEVGAAVLYNESSYIVSDSKHSVTAGHAATNFDENFASLMNVMTLYPEQFATKLKTTSENSQEFTVMLVRLMASSVVAKYPDLLGYLSEAEARFLVALYAN